VSARLLIGQQQRRRLLERSQRRIQRLHRLAREEGLALRRLAGPGVEAGDELAQQLGRLLGVGERRVAAQPPEHLRLRRRVEDKLGGREGPDRSLQDGHCCWLSCSWARTAAPDTRVTAVNSPTRAARSASPRRIARTSSAGTLTPRCPVQPVGSGSVSFSASIAQLLI